nr:TRAP transporter fused permease subunit [Microvirga lupini]
MSPVRRVSPRRSLKPCHQSAVKARTRPVPEPQANRALDLIAAALAIFVPVLAVIWTLSVPQRFGILIYPEQIAALMLGFSLTVVYLRDVERTTGVMALLNGFLALASFLLGLYVYWRFVDLSENTHRLPTEALVLGIFVVALVMEGVRRVIGWTLIIIFALLLLYALFGDYVPGPLVGRPQPIEDILRFLGTDSTATWGQSLQIAAFVVVLFVLFGSFLMATGGGDFFTQLASRVSGNGPGNTAKVAVTASALFGTISGSAVSNVMSTGVMTIPLMKRAGFKPSQAGAIEAVASTGGQLMPPVMGAAAFLMAELLQIPYRDIMLAAALPAILYYLSIYVQIDFMARRDNIASLVEGERPPILNVLIRGWVCIIAFAVLMVAILQFQMRAEAAAIWTVLAIAIFGLLAWGMKVKNGQMSPRAVLAAFVDTGSSVADVMLITAAAGMIIGLMTTTGLGFALSIYLLDFGGESMFGLLIITGIVGIVLGLGLPTTAVYLLLAALAAPALVQLGIKPIAAHMFVFYYGMLSMITPPIAMSAIAAASIAGSDQISTGNEAFRFGWIAYILPFLFIYKPGLLLEDSFIMIMYVFASSIVALVLVTGGILGYALAPLVPLMRFVWTVIGFATIAPLDQLASPLVEFAVSAVGVVFITAHVVMTRRERPAAVSLA